MRTRLLSSSKLTNPLVLYFIMITLGILSGLSGISYLEAFGALISDIFIRIFKFISTPIIALSIIVTLASYSEKGPVSKLWRKTLIYTISTTLVAAAVSCILYLLIQPQNVSMATEVVSPANAPKLTYLQHLLNLIPANIFSPFMEHQVIGVLLIGLLFGIAIRYIPDQDSKLAVTHFFKGIYGIFIVITKWIVAILPLGLYGFITTTVVELNHGMNASGIALISPSLF